MKVQFVVPFEEPPEKPLDLAAYVTDRMTGEVIASKPTASFDAQVTGATPMTADRFVGQLYQELKTSATR